MSTSFPAGQPPAKHPGTAPEVFLVFLRLGLTSFGGPVAHLSYFREAFVERRRWLSEKAYADLLALCHFLPGPASSQVGMALGLQRAGYLGMLAAWFAFTMPSVVLLVAFAYGVAQIGDLAEAGWVNGLKAAAVAVVAHAVLGMAKTFTPDAARATIAATAMIIVLLFPHPLVLLAAIGVCALIGLLWLRPENQGPVVAEEEHSAARSLSPADAFSTRVSKKAAGVFLGLFALLLAGLPALAALTNNSYATLAELFYRTGSLVFGGGHVVLPLLQAETVATGLVEPDTFLAGYGAAQAVPGPLFTFGSFLGASTTEGPGGLIGAAIATIAIFLPAALLVLGALPFWESLRSNALARRALLGVNASVVGILAAALYDPVFTVGILEVGVTALVIAVGAFVALNSWKAPTWAVVLGAGILGAVLL